MLAELVSGPVLVAGIAARIQAGPYVRAAGDTDEVYHRIYVHILRACSHRLPARFPQFVGPGRNTYPAGYHWALSFLPERASDAVGRHGALVGDLLLGGSVSLLLATKSNLPAAAAIALLGLYLASPALTMLNLGPRSFQLTPRLPSQLLFGAIGVSVIAADGHVSPALGLVLTVLLAANLLISKFTLQATVFALPVLAVASRPAVVLACFAGACALATVLSRGFFFRQVVGQAEHLEWYVKRQMPHMVRGMAWGQLVAAIRARNLRSATQIIALKNSVTVGLIRHFHVAAAAIWLLVETPELDPATKASLAFVVAGVVGWVATSAGVLRILGEAERYLEFAFPASWFLFWGLPHGTGLVVAIVLVGAYEAALHIAQIAIMRRRSDVGADPRAGRDEVLAILSRRESATVLFLDVTDAYAVHRLHGRVRAVMFSGPMSLRGDLAGFLDWFIWRFPLVHPHHLGSIVERYGVDVIVARRDALESARLEHRPGYDLTAFRLLFENSRYALFFVPSPAGLPEDRQRSVPIAGGGIADSVPFPR